MGVIFKFLLEMLQMTANQVGDGGLYRDEGEHISQTCVYLQELSSFFFDTHTRFLYAHRLRGGPETFYRKSGLTS